MRHLGSIVLSLLFAPVIYVLSGVGVVQMSEAQRDLVNVRPVPAVIGSAAFVIAGLLYAVLVMTRLSPLGPVLAGLGYAALSVWAVGDHPSFLHTVPGDVPGVHEAARLPAGTITTLLAVPLLATIVSPRRWRRWGGRPAAVATTGDTLVGYPESPYPGARAYQWDSTNSTMPLPPPPAAAPPTWPTWEESGDPEGTRRLR
jgi:hypothetical protein